MSASSFCHFFASCPGDFNCSLGHRCSSLPDFLELSGVNRSNCWGTSPAGLSGRPWRCISSFIYIIAKCRETWKSSAGAWCLDRCGKEVKRQALLELQVLGREPEEATTEYLKMSSQSLLESFDGRTRESICWAPPYSFLCLPRLDSSMMNPESAFRHFDGVHVSRISVWGPSQMASREPEKRVNHHLIFFKAKTIVAAGMWCNVRLSQDYNVLYLMSYIWEACSLSRCKLIKNGCLNNMSHGFKLMV